MKKKSRRTIRLLKFFVFFVTRIRVKNSKCKSLYKKKINNYFCVIFCKKEIIIKFIIITLAIIIIIINK